MAGRKAINPIASIKITGQRKAGPMVQLVALIQEVVHSSRFTPVAGDTAFADASRFVRESWINIHTCPSKWGARRFSLHRHGQDPRVCWCILAAYLAPTITA
jgi:hypothetical protein